MKSDELWGEYLPFDQLLEVSDILTLHVPLTSETENLIDKEQISMVITNTLATSGGMVCDGAKPSCASKIAVSLKSALMAVNMSKYNRCFVHGDGLVGKEVEETIENIGRMARLGMKSTDIEILRIMLK